MKKYEIILITGHKITFKADTWEMNEKETHYEFILNGRIIVRTPVTSTLYELL